MSTYAPLKFVEQMESYIRLYNSPSHEDSVNDMSMKFAEEFIAKDRHKLYHDFGEIRLFGSSKEIDGYYTQVHDDYCKKLGARGEFSAEDFVSLLIYYDTRNIWRKNKLSYLIDSTLFKTLTTMELPKLASVDCLTKLPANCFYIDYNGMGSEFMEDLEGSFVITDEADEELSTTLLHLVRGKDGRIIYVTTANNFMLTGAEKFIPDCDINSKTTLVCEDGVKRVIWDGKLANFTLNFFIYLHASNRDVEISERTRQNHDRPVQTIKNKFREVKEFEVGFVYGRAIGRDKKRVKYVGESVGTGVHSPKASHYRSAHWHHYWVGSGDDKKLIIKWVEGIFVNGDKEARNVRVCKVV